MQQIEFVNNPVSYIGEPAVTTTPQVVCHQQITQQPQIMQTTQVVQEGELGPDHEEPPPAYAP